VIRHLPIASLFAPQVRRCEFWEHLATRVGKWMKEPVMRRR
jgi:hypothetical protein